DNSVHLAKRSARSFTRYGLIAAGLRSGIIALSGRIEKNWHVLKSCASIPMHDSIHPTRPNSPCRSSGRLRDPSGPAARKSNRHDAGKHAIGAGGGRNKETTPTRERT